MVCLGNICRSPLAQGILESKLNGHHTNWHVDSAGTGSWHIGEKPDPRSIDIALKHGIDISQQRARQIIGEDLDTFDLILAMDTSNYQNVIKMARNSDQREKVKLILNYTYPGQNRAVPDPYFDGGFQKVYDLLNEAMDQLISSFGIMKT